MALETAENRPCLQCAYAGKEIESLAARCREYEAERESNEILHQMYAAEVMTVARTPNTAQTLNRFGGDGS